MAMTVRSLAWAVLFGSMATPLWLFMAGAYSWGYYNGGISHAIAATLAWPFFVSIRLPVPEDAQSAFAIGLMFASATGVGYLLGAAFPPRRQGR